jgi:hypothetical protein
MVLMITLAPFLVLRNSKLSLTTPFSCFYNWIRLTADVRTTGGSRPVFTGAAASCGVASVLAESVHVRCLEQAEEVPGDDLLGGGATQVL